jgi:hypothetical protein
MAVVATTVVDETKTPEEPTLVADAERLRKARELNVRLQEAAAVDHGERLARLEQRLDDMAKVDLMQSELLISLAVAESQNGDMLRQILAWMKGREGAAP